MEWKTYSIAEIGEVVGGGTPSTSNSEFWGGDIPWITPKDLTGYYQIYISHGANFLTDKGLRAGTRLLPKDTILFSSRAPIGYIAIASNPICTNQGFKSIICKKELVYPLFLYYYIKSNLDYFKIFGTGATFPEISGTKMKKIKVSLPPLSIQRKIASILSAYDNLIENNNKRIKLLEQMAETLYKEWFVRFRFPGHENVEKENGLPKGWKKTKAEERYTISIGKTPPRKEPQWFTQGNNDAIQWLSISDMNGTYTSDTNEKLTVEAVEKFHMIVVPKETILLSFKLSVGRVTLAANSMCTNEAIAHFRDVSPIEKEYLFLQLKTFEYSRLGNTSAIGNAVNSKIIKSMPLVLPNESVMLLFHNIASSIFSEINSLQQQSQLLIRQRDLLLPRLMSSKLEVKP